MTGRNHPERVQRSSKRQWKRPSWANIQETLPDGTLRACLSLKLSSVYISITYFLSSFQECSQLKEP